MILLITFTEVYMTYSTPVSWHSYQSFPWSPAELEDSEQLSIPELHDIAVSDDFEAYSDLLPFNRWDYTANEQPENSYYEALFKLAKDDEYARYRQDESCPSLGIKAFGLWVDNAVRCGVLRA